MVDGPSEPSGAVSVREPKAGSKLALIVALMRRPGGATMAEMIEATGWFQHTIRGAMAGTLAKSNGLRVTSVKAADEKRRWSLPPPAEANAPEGARTPAEADNSGQSTQQ